MEAGLSLWTDQSMQVCSPSRETLLPSLTRKGALCTRARQRLVRAGLPPLLPRCARAAIGRLWSCCARCIVVDFMHFYVWSEFLAWVCFITITFAFMEAGLDNIWPGWTSRWSCSSARWVPVCSKSGSMATSTAGHVVIDPIEKVELFTNRSASLLFRLAVIVSCANSRYIMSHGRFLVVGIVFTIFAAALCGSDAASTISDFVSCWPRPQDWTELGPAFASATSSGKMVAEYCSGSPHADLTTTSHRLSKLFGYEKPLATSPAERIYQEAILKMWAAWMATASFSISLNSPHEIESKCSLLLDPTFTFLPTNVRLTLCLTWLNNSAIGNSIDCPFNFEEILDKSISEILTGCHATISGRNFALQPNSVRKHTRVLPHLLLSMATRGLNCPASWASSGLGLPQVEGSPNSCMYLNQFLDRRNGTQGTVQLVPANTARSYLHLDYFHCVVSGIESCAYRASAGAASLTFLRSVCAAGGVTLMLLGCLWVLSLRIRNFLGYGPLRLHGSALRICAGLQMMRPILFSRVGLALGVTFLMQVGHTVLLYRTVWDCLDCLPSLPNDVEVLMKCAVCFQCSLVLFAVIGNFILYSMLRKQILAMSAPAFFGEEPPIGYHGPDLADIRKMGSSTVVYAMLLPGMVFWHFLFASWLLTLYVTSIIYVFMLILHDPQHRSPYAPYAWAVVRAVLFTLSVMLSRYAMRLILQDCLFEYGRTGTKTRCLCLFSLWEVFCCFIGVALGPITLVYDIFKSVSCTLLASLILQKPNFIQFGELSDYVYCTYCAALYLERVAHDARHGHETGGCAPTEDATVIDVAEVVHCGCSDGHPGVIPLEEIGFRFRCLTGCCGFALVIVGIPGLTLKCLEIASMYLSYPVSQEGAYEQTFEMVDNTTARARDTVSSLMAASLASQLAWK